MTGSPSSELNIRPRWWPALVICARSTGAKKPPTGTSSGWRSEPPPGINRARLAKQALANGWQPGTIAAPQVGNRQPKFFNDAGVVELVDTRDLKSLSREGVPVQVRPPVPYCPPKSSGLLRTGFVTIPPTYGNS
jgi:hypothetical protein